MITSLFRTLTKQGQPSLSIGDLRVTSRVRVRASVELVSAPILSPITKRPCAYYLLQLSEWINGHKTPFLIDRSPKRFVLEDTTGSVMALGADVTRLQSNRERGHSSDFLPEIRALSALYKFSMIDEYGELRSLDFTETLLLPGDTIVTEGRVESEVDPGGAASYREQPSRLVYLVDKIY